MGLLGRRELDLDSQVNLPSPTAEPASTAGGQHRGLVQLRHAQDTAVELTSHLLAPGWNGELDVMEPLKRKGHSATIAEPDRSQGWPGAGTATPGQTCRS